MEWIASEEKWENRFDHYNNSAFIEGNRRIHWYSIVNSLLVVIFLTVILSSSFFIQMVWLASSSFVQSSKISHVIIEYYYLLHYHIHSFLLMKMKNLIQMIQVGRWFMLMSLDHQNIPYSFSLSYLYSLDFYYDLIREVVFKLS